MTGGGGKYDLTIKRNYTNMQLYTVQLHLKAIIFGLLCFPLFLGAINCAFGFGENPSESWFGGGGQYDLALRKKVATHRHD